MENELWKPIPGYDGFYEVSNQGRVRSWKLGSRWGNKRSVPKILKTGYTKTGGKRRGDYLMNVLCKDGKMKTRKLHRLVAEVFIPNPRNKECVNHINGIKDDNRVENLEWVTKGENNKHAYDTGLNPMDHLTGSSHPNSDFTEYQVKKIRQLYKVCDISHQRIADLYGADKSTIGRIIRRQTWRHI